MTPLLVATGGHLPCRTTLKIATNGFIGICSEVTEQTGSGGSRWKKPVRAPVLYGKQITYESDVDDFKVFEESTKVEESSQSYQREIDRFNRAREQIQFKADALKDEIEILALRNDVEEQLRKEFLISEQLKMIKFAQDLRDQVKDLIQIKKRREEEEVVVLIIAANY